MKKTIIIATAIFALTACKPSVKNELNKWEHNQKNIQTALAKYGNFSRLVLPVLNQAKADWKKAEAITNEEEKGEAMNAINDRFSEGLLNKLTQVVYKSKSVDDGIRKLTKLKVSKSVLPKINSLVSKARKKQSDARGLMYSADTSSMESATKAAQSAISKLISAASDVRSATKMAKKK